MTRVTVGFEVITAAGVIAYTSDSLDLAKEWVAERKLSLPGAYVEQVTTTVERRPAYRPRLRVVA